MLAAASHDFYRTCRRGNRELLPAGKLQSTWLVLSASCAALNPSIVCLSIWLMHAGCLKTRTIFADMLEKMFLSGAF